MPAAPKAVARLEAGAKGGTAGVAEFDRAQEQVKEAKNQAIVQLRHDNALVNAPGALTAQLEAQLAVPAQAAIGNLAMLGAAAGNSVSADQRGTDRYLSEANAALPVITASARRDEAQREAMLAAQNAGRSSSSGIGGPLSDSEMRLRLLGEAQAIRGQEQTAAQQQYQGFMHNLDADIKHQLAPNAFVQAVHAPGGLQAPMMAGSTLISPGSFLAKPEVVDQYRKNTATIYQSHYDDEQALRHAALARILNTLHGPGIAAEAQQLGVQAGLDPGLVAGLVGPNEEQAYLADQKKLGYYQDPNEAKVSNQILDPQTAGSRLGYDNKLIETAVKQRHFVWSDPGSIANKGLAAFVKATDADEKLYHGLTTAADIAKARRAFENTPAGKQYASNVVSDVLGDAHNAVRLGLDYNTWRANLAQTPEYEQYPRTFRLAFAQAAPLFAYVQAGQRTLTNTGG